MLNHKNYIKPVALTHGTDKTGQYYSPASLIWQVWETQKKVVLLREYENISNMRPGERDEESEEEEAMHGDWRLLTTMLACVISTMRDVS